MSEVEIHAAEAPPPPAPPPAPRRRRGAYRLALFVVLALLLAGVLGTAGWLAVTVPGTAWLLARVPGLTVAAPQGRLLGDFDAERIELRLADGTAVLLQGLRWRGLSLHGPSAIDQWLSVRLNSLHADRIDVTLPPPSSPPSAPPARPSSLRLPVQFELAELTVGELHSAALGGQPLRQLRATLHAGADRGALHRIDGLALTWGLLKASGALRIAAQAPFDLDAQVELAQAASPELVAWQASATLKGPLDTPALNATLRAQPSPGRPAQALDLQATLRPFARWPLGDLRAHTEALDLSALHPAAPVTSLSGQAVAETAAMDRPATVTLDLRNAQAGRWNDGRLPLRRVQAEAQARPDTPDAVTLQRIDIELGTTAQAGGRVTAQGAWSPDQWQLDAKLEAVQPTALDGRAAAMTLSGPVSATGEGFASGQETDRQVRVRADLAGRLSPQLLAPSARGAGAARTVTLRLDATLNTLNLELREFLAQAGEARATAEGRLQRAAADAPWQLSAKAALADFDPLPWWQGEAGSPWRKGPHRLNADITAKLSVPALAPPPSASSPTPATPPAPPARPGAAAAGSPLLQALANARGELVAKISRSQLAGVPLSGELEWHNPEGRQALPRVALDLGGNRIQADARLSTDLNAGAGANDSWTVDLAAPALKSLAPLWQLLQGPAGDARFTGSAQMQATVNGRWPVLRAAGELNASDLRAGPNQVQSARGKWQVGTEVDAPLQADLAFTQLQLGDTTLGPLNLELTGTGRAHRLSLSADTPLAPPPWAQALQATPRGNGSAGPRASAVAGAPTPLATATATAATATATASSGNAASKPASAAAPARASTKTPNTSTTTATAPAPRSTALLRLQGGWSDGGGATTPTGWRGKLEQLAWQDSAAKTPPWLQLRDVGLALQWAGGPARITMEPGRAELLGGALSWSRLAWQDASATGPASIDVQVQIEPLAIAPLLSQLQPGFGWGGDLKIGGHVLLRSGSAFQADVVIERQGGDLSVTDEAGTQALGLSDLRLALNVDQGVWSFTQGLAGKTLGVGAGAVVMRTSPQVLWPRADTPLQGVLELQVANLGTWGTWVPAGWRLGGALRTSAAIAGTFGAPEYTGEIRGKGLSVRNFLEGVNVSDGELAVSLRGETARIDQFEVRAGAGRLTAEGSASFGDTPKAQLKVKAERFQLLGRVDRRIVTSGEAQLQLDRDTLRLDGKFGVDEGLIDFTRSDAPSLSDDVVVVRATPDKPKADPAGSDKTAATPARKVALNLQVGLGDQLRLRGRGLDTRLIGELAITSPEGRLAVNGVVSTADGKFAAYGQKLTIDRGRVIFGGPVDNPRLDIEAVRPDIEQRVGVAITGTAVTPRIRLFSVPELSEVSKLSWLVLGRASDSLGGAETALLQQAALALLSGEGEGKSDQIIKAIGLDQLSVRQSDGEVRETVVSLGRKISQRWYVGYERSLNATAGTWQLIYRVAQSFTLRAQAGMDTSLDAIWSWRW